MGLVSKLIPTLFDKKNYICHIKNLQLYVDSGNNKNIKMQKE